VSTFTVVGNFARTLHEVALVGKTSPIPVLTAAVDTVVEVLALREVMRKQDGVAAQRGGRRCSQVRVRTNAGEFCALDEAVE